MVHISYYFLVHLDITYIYQNDEPFHIKIRETTNVTNKDKDNTKQCNIPLLYQKSTLHPKMWIFHYNVLLIDGDTKKLPDFRGSGTKRHGIPHRDVAKILIFHWPNKRKSIIFPKFLKKNKLKLSNEILKGTSKNKTIVMDLYTVEMEYETVCFYVLYVKFFSKTFRNVSIYSVGVWIARWRKNGNEAFLL